MYSNACRTRRRGTQDRTAALRRSNRSNRPRINRRIGAHIQQNRGKQSVSLDINTAEGQAIVRQLVPHVDVVVENFSPGVLARKGLSYGDLSLLKPDLVMASVSGFGQTSPYSERACFELIAQGFAGLMHMTGENDGEPMFSGIGLADTNAGAHAFGAIGHALFHRERTGRGTHLDISMVDSLFHFHDMGIHAVSMDPDAPEPIRQRRDYPTISPAGAFRGSQGWIIILSTEWQMTNPWSALLKIPWRAPSPSPGFHGRAPTHCRPTTMSQRLSVNTTRPFEWPARHVVQRDCRIGRTGHRYLETTLSSPSGDQPSRYTSSAVPAKSRSCSVGS